MSNKVDVLIDKKRNEISITTIDDTTSEEVETTLSVAEAWNLVADLNEAIAKLKPEVQVVGNAKFNKEQLAELGKALEKSNKAFNVDSYRSKVGEPVDNISLSTSGLISPANIIAAQSAPVIKHGGNYIKTNAVSTTHVPEAKHRPYSGTMNN
jgi:hypothetical protein